MRLLVLAIGLCVGCDSGRPPDKHEPPVPPPPPALPDAALPDAALPDAALRDAHPNPELAALQASLGAAAVTCAGTAKLLASQGTASPETVKRREQSVLELCTDDRWPVRVRDCVATTQTDQLACTAYLQTTRQRTRWNAVFEMW